MWSFQHTTGPPVCITHPKQHGDPTEMGQGRHHKMDNVIEPNQSQENERPSLTDDRVSGIMHSRWAGRSAPGWHNPWVWQDLGSRILCYWYAPVALGKVSFFLRPLFCHLCNEITRLDEIRLTVIVYIAPGIHFCRRSTLQTLWEVIYNKCRLLCFPSAIAHPLDSFLL